MKYLDQNGILTDEYYGYVYVTLDQKHNKVYVGQKKGKPEKTKHYVGSGTILNSKIKSRGKYFLKKTILGICYTKDELTECETECKLFFDALNPLYGYNILERDMGGWVKGRKLSKEHIEKCRLANIGKKRSLETRKNISDAHLGHSPWNKGLTKENSESVRKISDSRIGREVSEETKQKQSEAKLGSIPWNKGLTKETDERVLHLAECQIGREVSEETKQKISINRTGIFHTEETKRKISEAGKGRTHSEETKQKISVANTGKMPFKGKKHTEETKQKISETLKGHKHSEETLLKISITKKIKIDLKELVNQFWINCDLLYLSKYFNVSKKVIRSRFKELSLPLLKKAQQKEIFFSENKKENFYARIPK